MLARNSNNGVLPNNPGSAKSVQNRTRKIEIPKSSGIARTSQNLTPKVDLKSHHLNKKTVIDVSNISLLIRSSKKSTDSTAKAIAKQVSALPIEISKSDIGVQVDEVEIIASQCHRDYNMGDGNIGDAPVFRLPSKSVVKEIEKNRKQAKDQKLKARLGETRKFEPYEARKEVHLTNLKEFLDTGAITRSIDEYGDNLRLTKPISKNTQHALDSQDRIKQKQEELMKIFNSI